MAAKKKNGKRKGTGVGIIAFGAIFALISVIFHPHSVAGYTFTALASLLAGTVIGIMGSGLDTSVNQKTPESLQKVQTDTGNAEVDALLQKGREMITQIRAENDLIPDSDLSEKLDQLEAKCAEIFRTVYDKPSKAPQIRKFMEYYLPTTLKMVRGYRMMDERGITGDQASRAKWDIREALGIVVGSCDTMLQKLYRDDMLDLSTDIDVLQQMLKRDGLTESELEQAAAQALAAARLDRQVNARREAPAAPQTQPQNVQMEQPRTETGVQNAVQTTVQAGAAHIPQSPTIYGGTYSMGGGQAVMQSPTEQKQ